MLVTSPLFDADWYLQKYPDVAKSGASPERHFYNIGWREDRNPNPYFDVSWYRKKYPQVCPPHVNPLQEYEKTGWKKGRCPSPRFDAVRYIKQNHDVQEAGVEPLQHFLLHGRDEGRQAFPLGGEPRQSDQDRAALQAIDPMQMFDVDYYRMVNPEIFHYSDNKAKQHFRKTGRNAGLLYAPPSKAKVQWTVKAKPRKIGRPKPLGGTPLYSSPLVISGFHRSGTSLTSNLFSNAGLHIGKELLGAAPSNPYGHFEDVEVVAFHDRILKKSGSYWQDSFDFVPIFEKDDWTWLLNYGCRKTVYPVWGFKDPRICLFLPHWNQVFQDMRVLYVYRSCIECVHSIKRRAAKDLRENRVVNINRRFWLSDDLAVKMYLLYASSALRFLENFPGEACVIELDDVLQGRDVVKEVRENWGYALADANIRDIYDSSVMSRSGPNELIVDPHLFEQVEEVESKLISFARMGFTKAGVPYTKGEVSI